MTEEKLKELNELKDEIEGIKIGVVKFNMEQAKPWAELARRIVELDKELKEVE